MLQANGMAGPVFISVGTAEKMSKFLELNPKINAQMAFVDDSSTFDAYEAVGFKKLGDSVPKNINMKAPALSGAQWWAYASNVMKLSPVDVKNMKAEVPEGVLRLGGTFVLDGDQVVYAWADAVPGDLPGVDNVLAAVGVSV